MTSSIKELPLLSVIVPAYNSENTIYDCIQSICRQTYKNLEIIVIDDGSTDKTYEILLSLKESDDRIKLFRQDNSGAARARNKGIENMHGDLLTFVDSDDTIVPEMYEIMFDIMCEKQCDVVICDLNSIRIGNARSISYNNSKFGEYDSMTVLRNIIVYDNLYGGGFVWNKLFNYKKIRQKSGRDILFNEDLTLYEDKCWCADALSYSEKVYITEKKLYNYTIRSDSISHEISIDKMLPMLDAWDLLMKKSESMFDETSDIFRAYTEAYISMIWKFRNCRESRVLDKWSRLCRFRKSTGVSFKAGVKFILLSFILGKGK